MQAEEPEWYKRLYAPKAGVRGEWYASLMSDFSAQEALSVCRSCEYFVAAGPDGVGAGVWRIAAEKSVLVQQLMGMYMTACVRLGVCPSSGKESIIVPIPKKQHVENTTSNIRPISLQNAIVKLLMKGLALRLGRILHAHPILHRAQEAFLKGGAAFKCVDVCLDIWEIAKQHRRPCYNLFYDIEQAYDSVRCSSLLRALARLRMPESFIGLIRDSLTDLRSCVRTAYGLTEKFPVQRSVRQGDPLAPLLYICFMDALHSGFECNPMFGDARDGFVLDSSRVHSEECASSSVSSSSSASSLVASSSSSTSSSASASVDCVASKGFADDTWAVSGSVSGLFRMNAFAHEWAKFNFLRFHPRKTKMVGRDAAGECMHNEVGSATEIRVQGVATEVTPLSGGIDYVGACISMDLASTHTIAAINRLIGHYSHLAIKYHMTVAFATTFFNTYLLPALENKLRYVQPTQAQAHAWDMMLVRCFNRLSEAAFCLKPEVVALVTGLRLPSQQEQIIKLSECFLRLNGASESSITARLRWSDRVRLSEDGKTGRSSVNNRLTRVQAIAWRLGWAMEDCRDKSLIFPFVPVPATPYAVSVPVADAASAQHEMRELSVPLLSSSLSSSSSSSFASSSSLSSLIMNSSSSSSSSSSSRVSRSSSSAPSASFSSAASTRSLPQQLAFQFLPRNLPPLDVPSLAPVSSFVSSSASSSSSVRMTRSRARVQGESGESEKLPTGCPLLKILFEEQRLSLVFDFYNRFGRSEAAKSIRIFTDGSAPQAAPKSLMSRVWLQQDVLSASERSKRKHELQASWAICYEGDYHREHWPEFKLDEEEFREHPPEGAAWVGGPIECKTSIHIFAAELQAIVRTLFSVPLSFSIVIIADSESSLKAIRSYMSEPNERKRMRQSGRPLLQLIAYQILERLRAGATISFQHERSHTGAATCESRGNACADYWAEQMRKSAGQQPKLRAAARSSRSRSVSSQIKQLEVERGEGWVCVRDKCMGCVVLGDVRRAAQQQQSVQNMWKWLCSPTQGAYADERVRELCEEVLGGKQARPMRVLLLVLTNTLHRVRVHKHLVSSMVSSSSSSSSSLFASSSSSSSSYVYSMSASASAVITSMVAPFSSPPSPSLQHQECASSQECAAMEDSTSEESEESEERAVSRFDEVGEMKEGKEEKEEKEEKKETRKGKHALKYTVIESSCKCIDEWRSKACIAHLLLVCPEYEVERDKVLRQVRALLVSLLRRPSLPLRPGDDRTLVSVHDCDLLQLLFLLVHLPPAFQPFSDHPAIQHQSSLLSAHLFSALPPLSRFQQLTGVRVNTSEASEARGRSVSASLSIVTKALSVASSSSSSGFASSLFGVQSSSSSSSAPSSFLATSSFFSSSSSSSSSLSSSSTSSVASSVFDTTVHVLRWRSSPSSSSLIRRAFSAEESDVECKEASILTYNKSNANKCPASYLPLNVIGRWAFGGFSLKELDIRLQRYAKDTTLIASVCQELRSALWDFACSVSVRFMSLQPSSVT